MDDETRKKMNVEETFAAIDKIIGKLYPLFGICLIIMAIGIAGATIVNNVKIFFIINPPLQLYILYI